LVAARLVVLRDPLARRDVDHVDAERLNAQGAAHEHPVAGLLHLVRRGDGVGAHRAGPSRAGSFAGRTSHAQLVRFQSGTGTSASSLGTNRERSTSAMRWM